ncbi:MAG: SpoIIE family protein phosphatase, partial [Bacteroidota bacterium]|nr:SpoIIE family protein phosphatase [Bacteroidota bacterium]
KYKFYNGKYSSDTLNSLLRSIYKNAKAKDSNYIMGLYDNGIVYTDDKLNIKKHISTTTGLQNNTIYSLFVDKHSNVWAGMSNGISIIHSNSPFSVYDNNFGLNGTTLSSVLFNNHLYIGNSTGVYQMNWKNRGPERKNEFSAIENKLGAFQIWQLENIDNQLVCSGTSGIFYIQNNKAEYIQENESVKSFIQLKYRPNTILTIGGNGLATITRKDSIWGNFEAVAGFKKDFRDIIQYSRNTFWASDRKKGIIKLSLTETLDSVNYKKSYGIKDGLPDDIGNQVLIINNKLIVATAEGVYRYDDKNDIFIPDEFFGETLGKTVKVTELIHDANNNIWFKQKVPDPKIPNKSNWILGLIKLLENDVEVEKTIFKKLKNNIHSINPITEHETLIGTEQGFVIYNNTKENPLEYDFNAIIRHIEIVKNDSVIFGGCFSDTTGIPMLKQNPKRIPILPYNYNDVRIYFSALFFEDPEQNKYKFILEGNDMQWSDWKTETKKEYSNLEPGQYTFRVIAKNLYNQESQEAVYTFEILPPYYRTVLAFIVYGILFILFIWGIVALSTHRVKKQKENLERIVEQRTQEIQKANIELNNRNEVIKRKNLDITSSINYAKRIQEAMLPIKDQIKQSFDDSFILFKPRDIVSGDFYWFEEKNDKVVIAAVDCTGHGVPGAFMSLIGSEILTTIVGKNIFDPKLILSKMNNYVVTALKQEATTNQDGMDMALCVVDKKTKTVEFAGAKNPLVYISNNEIHKIRGSRKGIGGYQEQAEFTSEVIEYQSPSYFYIFSDGFQDQFGGPKNRKFMIRKLRQLLFEIHKLPGKEQHQILDNAVENWKGIGQQTDDILLIGFKI